MIEKEITLTGKDAELLSRALSEVKTKAYEVSEARLNDTEALELLVLSFRTGGFDGIDKYLSLAADRYFVKNGLLKEEDVYPTSVY